MFQMMTKLLKVASPSPTLFSSESLTVFCELVYDTIYS